MTKHQAWAEARRRWGHRAVVQLNPAAEPEYRCRVGWRAKGGLLRAEGHGEKWEKAFADSERTEAREAGEDESLLRLVDQIAAEREAAHRARDADRLARLATSRRLR